MRKISRKSVKKGKWKGVQGRGKKQKDVRGIRKMRQPAGEMGVGESRIGGRNNQRLEMNRNWKELGGGNHSPTNRPQSSIPKCAQKAD
jgi:hypothetical protein